MTTIRKRIRKIIPNFENFRIMFHNAAEKGILLISAAALAVIIANSQFAELYRIFFYDYIKVIFGETTTVKFTLHHFINDLLMAIFFLLVGLEIKRELVAGHLSQSSQRILPVVAAISGVVFPSLIYWSLNHHDAIKVRGWAIPAATDIAFALGVFALFARGLPNSLRIFLTALAIIDDLIAVLIIAFFYSGGLEWGYIIFILATCFVLYFLNLINHTKLVTYSIIGAFLWYLFLKSGIHTTVAGVLLGFFIPYKCENTETNPSVKMEHTIHPWVSYAILPIFAFANSGVVIQNFTMETLTNSVSLGIILGLVVGKSIGITGTVMLLQKLGITKLPKGSNLVQFFGVALLCGIGFTMSLFIGVLAYEDNYQMITNVKVGVLVGSIISATLGALVIRFCCTKEANA